MPAPYDDRYQLPNWPPTTFNLDLWNLIFGSIADRLTAREALEASFEALIAEGTQASLDYIQATIAPQIASLQETITLAQDQIDQIVNDGIAPDSSKLGGQLPAYYATASALTSGLAGKVSTSLTINGKPLTANVTLAKGDIGLGNVDNTADAGKPVSTAQAALFAQLQPGRFYKADRYSAAFTKTGAGTISLKAGTIIEVNGSVYTFAVDTAVSMPSLTAGTDYAIWIKPDGTLVATTDFVSPPIANARQIGGFHYAPGGNATAMAGGDTTPAINAYSIWDLKFRPACADPRGMTLVAGAFWCDIYLLGVDHLVNGTSKYNVTIADGSSPPKIPTLFGGNGTSVYGGLTWWQAAEVMASYGKRLLSYQDFAAAAYGTTENSSAGTDPVSTILRQAYTSKWGVMLATGNLWIWGDEFGGGNAAAGWADTNGGRGQVYQQSNALLLGGSWGDAAGSGSRASAWNSLPSDSRGYVGARGRCDHLCLA